jgi:drug/metabolite transporter (DMT)-like permease
MPSGDGSGPAHRAVSIGLALGGALGWAVYYVFVLWGTPSTAPSAVLVYPFVIGGVAYTLWTLASGRARDLRVVWSDPAAYARVGLMLGMQFAVLAATYLAGAVDASLLSLIGDVVATPLLAAALFAGPRSALGRPWFVAGLLLSLAGGGLAIVGGHRLAAVHGAGWLAVVGVPVAVGLYFLLSARASDVLPSATVVGQSIVGAAIGAAVLAPLVPGGWGGLVVHDPRDLVLLVANGLICFFVAPVLYFASLRREGVVVPPMLMTGIPIFTLVFAVVLLGESAPRLALLGIPIAVLGAIVVLRTVAASPPSPDRWARPGR